MAKVTLRQKLTPKQQALQDMKNSDINTAVLYKKSLIVCNERILVTHRIGLFGL